MEVIHPLASNQRARNDQYAEHCWTGCHIKSVRLEERWMIQALFAISIAYSVLSIVRFVIQVVFGLLGFRKDQKGKIQHGAGTMAGYCLIIFGGFELILRVSEIYGGAYVFGVIVGVYAFFLIPAQLILALWPKT